MPHTANKLVSSPATAARTVALVEDQPEIRDSWARLIASFPDFTCACMCSSGEEAVRLIPALQPDVDRFYDSLIPTHQKLFDRLDYLTDVEEEVRWLDELVEATKPATAWPSAQPSGTGPRPSSHAATPL